MTQYLALLRGINVSGQKLIKMADLRRMFEELGYGAVRTYIQSGNVWFEAVDDAVTLRARIEQQITAVFGFQVTVMIRTLTQLKEILQACPFPMDEEESGLIKTYVALLSEAPEQGGMDKLLACRSETDEFRIAGQEVYILCRIGMGKSMFTNNFIEKKLGVAATTRNWKTMKKLTELGSAV